MADLAIVFGIESEHLAEAKTIPHLAERIEAVRRVRLASPDKGANALAKRAHQLKLMRIGQSHTIVVPSVSSERRPYLPVGLVDSSVTLTNLAFGLYDAPLWNMALIASKLHLVWIATVCGKLKTDYRYSNTLGWNTFPVPTLTEQNKADLTRARRTSCWRARRISRRRLPIFTIPTRCPPTCARPTSATTRPRSASTSAAASKTTPSGWKNSSSFTPR